MAPVAARVLASIALVALGVVVARLAGESARSNWPGADSKRYRPRGRRWRPFDDASGTARPTRSIIRRSALNQLRDALSGAPLTADDDLFRCADCQSFYTAASVRALANENSARCLHCGSMHRMNVEVID